MKQSPIPYQRGISPEAFRSIAGARSGMPYRTIETQKFGVFAFLSA